MLVVEDQQGFERQFSCVELWPDLAREAFHERVFAPFRTRGQRRHGSTRFATLADALEWFVVLSRPFLQVLALSAAWCGSKSFQDPLQRARTPYRARVVAPRRGGMGAWRTCLFGRFPFMEVEVVGAREYELLQPEPLFFSAADAPRYVSPAGAGLHVGPIGGPSNLFGAPRYRGLRDPRVLGR